MLYTDGSILPGPDKSEIENTINSIKEAGLSITFKGDISDFLGINITKMKDGAIK